MLPDAGGDLSEGVVVRAQLLGRVLGLRVLRVDGTVLLSPALSTRGPMRDRTRPTGQELAEAARLLGESDTVLHRGPADVR